MPAINYGTRGRLGVLLPSGNQAAEPQFHAMLPHGVSMHTTRLKLTGSRERELLAMAEDVEAASRLVCDAGASLVVFHCTAVSTFSASFEASILERIRRACGRPVTATSEAIVAALRVLGAARIVMLSPYVEAINAREEAYFRGFGFEVIRSAGLGKPDADGMMSITPAQWVNVALAHRDDRADAYLISCTTVRSAEVVEELESALERPVITSNTATVWHALRTLRLDDRIVGFGRLLCEH